MGLILHLILLILGCSIPSLLCQVSEFVSVDCGGTSNHTDPKTTLPWVSDSGLIGYGTSVEIENPNGNSIQYQNRRDFPIDNKKYCYTLNTTERRRYIIRATFLYGSSQNENTYPKFQLYLDATRWATISVMEASTVYIKEMIIRAPSSSIDVCLCCATTGSPFISTLEQRPLNLSMYATDFEDNFYLKVAARVNFGAASTEALRYPDDPYDRIWDSDLAKRQNFLVGVAPGTIRINTTKDINTNTREYPPVKVMQTAVVGTQGTLSYRLNLEDFPANARAYAYFAEIENLPENETRKFTMMEPYIPDYSNAVVNIEENANGTYTLYEPSYMNISLSFVLSFSFKKTQDSTQGPLLNALEISKYVPISPKTDRKDVNVLDAFRSMLDISDLIEEGDPCVPAQWEWVSCSSNVPPRISKIALSGSNLEGEIPSGIKDLQDLTELWLNENSLSGSIPDMSNLEKLTIVHLENNKLTGSLPSYFGTLPNLKELYIQNNSLSGDIPPGLLTGKVNFFYAGGNHGLHKHEKKKSHFKVIFGISVGILAVLFILFIGSLLLLRHFRKKAPTQRIEEKGAISSRRSMIGSTAYSAARGGSLMEEGTSYYFSLAEIEEATSGFSKKIGKGSFGPVYYGKTKDGKELAVKMMADSSSHGAQQFVTEVALLSRIHHRNLVPLIGYCEEEHHRMLVYEYMHNGTLRDHIHDKVNKKHLDWRARLRVAEDSAKGLEYLHNGCHPSIIHRDIKTSNILLDINMRAKVSDFGLSRQTEEDLTHISSVARGTVGYLDPEYYANQQLTEKSDVYSFGVVLLELISGRKPVSPEEYGADWSIVHWARSLIRKGDVVSIIDPTLAQDVKIESVWRIAEVAIQCVDQNGSCRPRMQEIILAIQDAIKIENGNDGKITSDSSRAQSSRKTLLTTFLDIDSPDLSNDCLIPSAR
ncbi:probable LRR receptor-like serine/threonine-protein kinase At1g67720 [Rutidosis leptorrhynchoides]|uniref:probable LRR receptor-like serine/threonine-protein kinase At1g67720 n=1 Tax=Rutidosis leptorrhynchoides TaxID=125765 RepID=UPI003A9939D3